MIIKSKRGNLFYMVLGVFSVVALFGFYLFVLTPTEGAFFDIDYELLETTDLKNNVLKSEKIYVETYVPLFLQNSKNEFLGRQIEIGFWDELTDVNQDEFVGCAYYGNHIFYNEKNKNVDSDLTNCILDLGESFDNDYQEYIVETIDFELDEGISDVYSSLDSVSIVNDEDSSNFKVVVDTSFEQKAGFGGIGVVRSQNRYEFETGLGDYVRLVGVLEEVLLDFSTRIGDEILSCRKSSNFEAQVQDVRCKEEILSNMISEKDSQLMLENEVELIEVVNEEVEDYLGYKLIVRNIVSGDTIVNFVIVIEDTIPFDVVSYSVNNFESLDNVVELKIVESSSSKKPQNYVIMYSYENFLDRNEYGTSRYDTLISMLQNSEIPNKFRATAEGYFHSVLDDDLDLNLILVDPNKDFSEGSRNINIYQIFDPITSDYELLESGREVYFAVFAVDSSFNYFTDETLLEQISRSIIPETKFGPDPIEDSDIEFKTMLDGFENSFAFTLDGYDDQKAGSFVLYVMKNRGEEKLEDFCFGASFECSYASILYSLGSSQNYFVTSDVNFELSGHTKILLDDISLDYNEEYEVLVVPYDESGNGILENRDSSLYFNEREYSSVTIDTLGSNTYGSFYEIKSRDVSFLRPLYAEVKIEDNRAPESSDIILSGTSINSDFVRLNYDNALGSDVKELLVVGRVFTSETEFNSFTKSGVTESSNELVANSNGEIVSVDIDKITMFDHAGNSAGYSGPIS